MLDVVVVHMDHLPKLVTALQEEFAAYQLVGGVKAHQGKDG